MPAQAPTSKVEMTISLTGFTEAFDLMRTRNARNRAQAEAAKAAEPPAEAPAEAPAATSDTVPSTGHRRLRRPAPADGGN